MKWRLQFVLLVALMCSLVLGGIHLAEKGTQRVDGVKGALASFHIARADSGSLEMTVLGKHYQLEDQGVVPVEEIGRGKNWMSQIGNNFGGWLSKITKTMISWTPKR